MTVLAKQKGLVDTVSPPRHIPRPNLGVSVGIIHGFLSNLTGGLVGRR